SPEIRDSGWDPFPHLSASSSLSPGVLSLADVVAGQEVARERPEQTVRYEQLNIYGWDSALYRWTLEQARARGLGRPL
ncbi:MAG: hypothetical protein WAM30_00085, partial [Candidatus Dormiibacterota bacterium]